MISASVGSAGAGTPKVTKPVSPSGSSSGSGATLGDGIACEGIGVGGPTTGSGVEGADRGGGGFHIGGAAGLPPVSPVGAPQAKDLNSSEASLPLTLVPW